MRSLERVNIRTNVRTYVRTYSHTYVRDRPYIPSTTLLSEGINRRMPICNPTIQLVVVDLYTKYEFSFLHGCRDIFDEKVLRNYRRTDGRTEGTTDRCKPVYPPLFQSGGIITVTISFVNASPLLFEQDWLTSYGE